MDTVPDLIKQQGDIVVQMKDQLKRLDDSIKAMKKALNIATKETVKPVVVKKETKKKVKPAQQAEPAQQANQPLAQQAEPAAVVPDAEVVVKKRKTKATK